MIKASYLRIAALVLGLSALAGVGYFVLDAKGRSAALEAKLATLEQQVQLQASAPVAEIAPEPEPYSEPLPVANSAPAVAEQSGIGAIFAPAAIEGDAGAAAVDKIKSDFESLFVTYQLLRACNMAEPYDYHLINSALAHEISSKNAPGRTQFDILTAAKGSYQEIYARTDCASANVADMHQKFRAYMQQVSQMRFVID